MINITGQARNASTRGSATKKSLVPILLGSVAVGAGTTYGLYKYNQGHQGFDLVKSVVPNTVTAAEFPEAQPSVSRVLHRNFLRSTFLRFKFRILVHLK